MKKVKVLTEFRDKFNFAKLYKAGDEVDGFDADRIADLVKRGLVEVPGSMTMIGSVDLSGSVAEVSKAIATVDDIQVLNEVLAAEKADKNRSGAIKAIEARITDLNPKE